ncbi:MAG: hypothetical protein HS108_06920 [Planctomycetes bacterium]|jgi:hypothetical protein|nr:hypothetical protein [Planctomycetota bacterium]MCL4729502.1 hypothetical protein [Planctomycetota bacterium]
MPDTKRLRQSLSSGIRSGDTSRRAGVPGPVHGGPGAQGEVAATIGRLRCAPPVRHELVREVRARVSNPGYDMEAEFDRALDVMARREFGL